MKVMLDPGAFPPLRAHDTDAGLDIRSREEVTISPGARAIVSTGTHVQLPEGTCGLLVSKSGLNLAWGIVSHAVGRDPVQLRGRGAGHQHRRR